jgi:histidine ammonia-lyase
MHSPWPGGSSEAIRLTGDALTLADVLAVARGHRAVARGHRAVALAPEVAARVAASRAVVEQVLAQGEAVYGLTTGLGANVGVALDNADLLTFQTRVLVGRAVAVGPFLPRETVRAALLLRANGLARGGAGASLAVIEALLALLARFVHPCVPSLGSIGAADLTPMAHLALPLVGRGAAELDGEIMPGGEALRRAGLAPVALAPKDGLALVSSNALSIAEAVLLLDDAAALLDLAALAAALSFEGMRANPGPLLAEVAAARPAPGQEAAASTLRGFLAGSALWERDGARAVQDALSFRCIAPVHGAALAALGFAGDAVTAELNAAADSPLVLVDSGRILSTGNFHTGALALAADTLAIALVPVADLAVGRAMKLMLPEASGLAKFLTPVGGNRAGFAPMQKTLAALRAECRHAANPASLDFTPVANGVEDHSPQTPLALRKATALCRSLRALIAIELMVAAQAIDLRDPAPLLGPPLAAAHRAIRARVERLEDDRSLGPEIAMLAAESNAILDAARAAF